MAEDNEPVMLRGYFRVRMGVVPGAEEREYTKSFYYTSEDYDYDGLHPADTVEETRFEKVMKQANDYYLVHVDPSSMNWVSMDFIWF